jgi:hypothetical protein
MYADAARVRPSLVPIRTFREIAQEIGEGTRQTHENQSMVALQKVCTGMVSTNPPVRHICVRGVSLAADLDAEIASVGKVLLLLKEEVGAGLEDEVLALRESLGELLGQRQAIRALMA